MDHAEQPVSPARTQDTDEAPHQFQGPVTPNVRRRESDLDSRDTASSLRSHHEPMLFSSSHRVNSEVDKAYREDQGPLRKWTLEGFWKAVWGFVRPGFFLDHLDYKSFQIVSRTWAAIFFSTLMLVISRLDHYVGVTAYLGLILSVIEVAGGISYSQAFYTSLVDLIFILFAFTTATIGHAISWRIRGYPTVESLMKELSDANICAVGDAACLLHETHTGRYLTTKTTVVMLFAIFFSLFITGWLSQKTRMLLIPQILSSITILITGLYLNITPQFSPWTYGRALVLPFGLALSARFVLSLFWFPVSSNYKFFAIVNQAFAATTAILKDDIGQIEDLKPSSDDYAPLVSKVAGKIDGAISKFALLELEGLLTRGEICYSRFDPGDLGEFRALARMLAGSLVGFSFFFDEILEKKNVIVGHEHHTDMADKVDLKEKKEAMQEVSHGLGLSDMFTSKESSTGSDPKHKRPTNRPQATKKLVPLERRNTLSQVDPDRGRNKFFGSKLARVYAPAGHFEDDRLDAALKLDWDDMHMEDLDDLYPQIIQHYKVISDAIIEVLNAVNTWGVCANNFRISGMLYLPWRKKHEKLQAQNSIRIRTALDALAEANEEKDKQFAEWMEAYSANHISRSVQHYINILSTDAFHGCTIRRVVFTTTRLAQYCLFLDQHQPRPRLIYPFMRLRSKSPRFESEYLLGGSANADAGDQAYMPYEQHSNVQRRDPDSTPPRNYYHLLGRQVMRVFAVSRDPHVRFAVKRAVFALLASLTYCTRTTVFFSYSYRVVWVAIMVALTISFQALDGVYGFAAKLYFTFFGCLIGMVVWYIGAGSEAGNPYGIAAAMGVVFVFLSFYRHFNTHTVPMGAIILCVTTVIVTGTSWNDSKLHPPDVKLGWGWHLAWIRFVCVITGLGIAFIGTLLPKPVTAKKNIRMMISASLEQLGDIQTSLCNFGIQRSRDRSVHIALRQDANRVKLRRVGVTVIAAKQLANRLDFEPPLGGIWPKHRYLLLLKLIGQLSHIMGGAHYLLDNIGDTSRIPDILQIMGWTDVELMSSMYSVLVLGSRSLAVARPLPSVTPAHLTEIYSRILRDTFDRNSRQEGLEAEAFLEERYVDHDGRITLTLVILMHMMFTRIDGCVRIIKGLVGEIFDVDLDVFKYDPEEGLHQNNENAIEEEDT